MIGIYKITNPKGEVYIGKSKDIHKRYLTHRVGSNSEHKLSLSFKEFGFENHKFEIIYLCGESLLGVFESYFIDKYNSIKAGLNSSNVVSDYSHLEFAPIEICEPYYVKNMYEDETRGAGAKSKFPNQETKQLQIKRIVPKEHHDEIKKKTNDFITKLQNDALDKCVGEVLKNK
jgi:group I intron endonuclease